MTSRHFRLKLVLILSALQLYLVPVGDVYLSLGFLSSWLLAPELINGYKKLLRDKLVVLLFLLLFMKIISTAWSPDKYMALREVIYFMPFLFILAASHNLFLNDPARVVDALFKATILAVAFGAMIVFFRLDPVAENAYYAADRISGLFVGPSVVQNLAEDFGRNNVIDPDKSGGIYVNANTGGVYVGICALVLVYASRFLKRKAALAAALFLWISIFFTGSKAAIFFSFMIPAYILMKSGRNSGTNGKMRISIRSILLAVFSISWVVVLTFIDQIFPQFGYGEASGETFSVRVLIWSYAFEEFLKNPILGQGYGGWQLGFGGYAASADLFEGYPPHNTLIYTWSQNGIAAVVLTVLIMVRVIMLARRLSKSKSKDIRSFGIALGCVASWIFLHGMGENWGLIGDVRMYPILASLIGCGIACENFRIPGGGHRG